MKTIYDPRKPNSLASLLRRKRFQLFESLLNKLPVQEQPIKILDVGGTRIFWENLPFLAQTNVEVTIYNLRVFPVPNPKLKFLVGDARDMKEFKDQEFDVVFSNSVIEHVGGYEDQRRMAYEIMRVSKRYFVQTPNRYFPVEPHFVFPFFQFLPFPLQVWLISNSDLGWIKKAENRQDAIEKVKGIQLLGKNKFVNLFPGAQLFEEKLLGLTKSFIVYKGWD